jgi:cytosine/creatinine deaminase
MGLDWDGVLRVGSPADLVLAGAASGYELVTPQGRARSVYREGRLIP